MAIDSSAKLKVHFMEMDIKGPSGLPRNLAESGTATVSHLATTINYSQEYTNPVVIIGIPSFNGKGHGHRPSSLHVMFDADLFPSRRILDVYI